MTLLVAAAALPGERLNRWQTLGILTSALGVIVLSAPWRYLGDQGNPMSLPAQLACLGSAVCYGVAYVYLRRFIAHRGYDSTVLAAGQVSVAAVIMLLVLPFAGAQSIQLSPQIGLSILLLGAVGTGFAYIWNTNILLAWGAPIASMVTYLSPVIGVALGMIILAEPLHWNEPLGGLVVIIGIIATKLTAGISSPPPSGKVVADQRSNSRS